MKYISLDLETTGLNENENNILEIGIVFVDTKSHKKEYFYGIVRNDKYVGSEYAINMNARIFKILSENIHPDIIHIDNLEVAVVNFLYKCGYNKGDKITVAGKNVGSFDLKFTQKHLPLLHEEFRISHRTLDPSILFLDIENDEEIPSLEECKIRAGFKNTKASHNALEDAKDIVDLIERYFEIKNKEKINE